MNTVNHSTGFSPFQLHLGCSPSVLPPLISLPTLSEDEEKANLLIQRLHKDIAEAHNNLLVAKVAQAVQANKHCSKDPNPDFVMLNTSNRHREYHQKSDGHTTKLMPQFDGKYKVVSAFLESSIYMIDMPNTPLTYSTFHTSKLWPYFANDSNPFLSQELSCPSPVVTTNSKEEWLVEAIIDEHVWGRGKQHLVQFTGYGPEDNHWILYCKLLENKALDQLEAQLLVWLFVSFLLCPLHMIFVHGLCFLLSLYFLFMHCSIFFLSIFSPFLTFHPC